MENNDYIILNPDYHFKVDGNRVLLYSKRNVHSYSASDWLSVIHPYQANLLCRFSELKTYEEHCKKIAKDFNITLQQAELMMKQYVENSTPVYTVFGSNKIVFPQNVLIKLSTSGKMPQKESIDDLQDYSDIDLANGRMRKAPHSLELILTTKCATKCKYCYADKKTSCKELTTKEILDIIDSAVLLKMSNIDVVGGEVFLKKDWALILKRLVETNLTPNYISTKVPIGETTVKELFDTGYNNVVQISFDSLSDKTLKETIGVKLGYVAQMKETIKNLEEYGFKIQIDTILTKYNSTKDEIDALFDYIKNIRNLVYWEIRVPEESIYSPASFNEVKASKKDLVDIRQYINDNTVPKAKFQVFCSDAALEEQFYKGALKDDCFKGGACSILQNRLFVLPDGKVTICEQLYWNPAFLVGDLKKQSLEEIWQSPRAKAIYAMNKDAISKDSGCYSCNSYADCNKKHRKCIVKITKAYGAKHWDYPDPRCCKAPKVQHNYLY